MRLVADLRHQHQRRRIRWQAELGSLVGKHQFFQAHFAALAFFHAHQSRHIQIQRHKHFTGHADLAFAAVNQHQVGKLGFTQTNGFSQLAVAARQHLAHGGVIVATGDALDVVAAVFTGLHFVVVKHHAGGLRGLASRMRNVKTLDTQAVQVFHCHVQSIYQGTGT